MPKPKMIKTKEDKFQAPVATEELKDLEMQEGDEELIDKTDLPMQEDEADDEEKLFQELLGDDTEDLDMQEPPLEEDEDLNLQESEDDDTTMRNPMFQEPPLEDEEFEMQESEEEPLFPKDDKKEFQEEEIDDDELAMQEEEEAEELDMKYSDDMAELEKLAFSDEESKAEIKTLRTKFNTLKAKYAKATPKQQPVLFAEMSKTRALLKQKLNFQQSDELPEMPAELESDKKFQEPGAGGDLASEVKELRRKVDQILSILSKKEMTSEELEAPADFSEEEVVQKTKNAPAGKTSKRLDFAVDIKTANKMIVKRLSRLEQNDKKNRCVEIATKALEGFLPAEEVRKDAAQFFDEGGPKGVAIYVKSAKKHGVKDPIFMDEGEFDEDRESDTVLKFSDTPERASKAKILSKMFFQEKARNPNLEWTEEEFISANMPYDI